MRLVQTTAPSSEPILLEELKTHLRIDGEQEDASISAFIAIARSAVETAVDLSLINRDIDIYADKWADLQRRIGCSENNSDSLVPGQSAADAVTLPVKPVSAVNAISVIDDDGVETIWPSSNYQMQPGLEPLLFLKPGATWPAPTRAFDSIKISVTAGFGPDWNAVPKLINQAIIRTATNLYLKRGDEHMPPANLLKAAGAEGLLQSFRRVRL